MKLLGRSAEADTGEMRRVTGQPGVSAPSPPPPNSAPIHGRLERLSQVVSGARGGSSGRNVRKIMQVLGALTIVFGFVCILLGWYGASHSPYLFEEMPYLISGGLLGIALVFAGGILIWGAWNLRQVEEERRNALAIVRSIDRLERIMRANTEGQIGSSTEAQQ